MNNRIDKILNKGGEPLLCAEKTHYHLIIDDKTIFYEVPKF